MKVALLGATGFVGSALLKEALDRGHVVTAIVRDPEKLEKREGLSAKAGDVYDTASLATLIRGNEATISAFNPGWKNPNLYDDQVRGTASIIAAIKKARIKRVLWVGGAGGLEVKPGVRVIDSPDMPLWVKPGSLATINALDQLRKEPELEWSFLSPSAELKTGQRTGKFRLGNDQLLVDATGQSIDRRQRTWLYPERHIRAVDNSDSRFDLQPTRSAHPERPFDSRLLNRGDDGCCSSKLVVIKVRVLPSRIEGADNCFVSSDQRRKRSRVVNVASLRGETRAFFKLLQMPHNRCHHVPSVERLLKQG